MITKHDFKDGDVVLVHNYFELVKTVPLYLSTQRFTRCYYHHCGMYKGGYIYESVEGGVKKTHSIEEYLKGVGGHREIAICRFPEVILEEIEANVGLPYNYVATLFFQPIYQVTDKYIGDKQPEKLNCSQYDAKCLGRKDYGTYDPQDLWREACVNNYVIKESAPKRREYINNKLK